MSITATRWAFRRIEETDMTPKAAQVLVALAWLHHEETGRCVAPMRTLVGRTRLSERAVRLAVRELETIGLLATTHRSTRSTRGKRNLPNSYTFRGGARDAGGVGHDVPAIRALIGAKGGRAGRVGGPGRPSTPFDLSTLIEDNDGFDGGDPGRWAGWEIEPPVPFPTRPGQPGEDEA